jgi:hypothetical protein
VRFAELSYVTGPLQILNQGYGALRKASVLRSIVAIPGFAVVLEQV